MLVFYPDFEVSSRSTSDEVILLLDTSESMKGESLLTAQRIALQVLKTLDHNLRVNIILFGTGWFPPERFSFSHRGRSNHRGEGHLKELL